jgi:hypothetical protein
MSTTPKAQQASKLDEKIISLFAKFIEDAEANRIRKGLTKLYADHTQMLVINVGDPKRDFVNYDTHNGLYFLSEIIEILDGGYQSE